MTVTVEFKHGAWVAIADEDDGDFRAMWASTEGTPQDALNGLAEVYTSQCEWYARQAERAAEVAAEARRMAKEYEQQAQV